MSLILFLRRLRSLLVEQLCKYGDQDCQNEATTVYSRWMQDPDGDGKWVSFCTCVMIDKIMCILSFL